MQKLLTKLFTVALLAIAALAVTGCQSDDSIENASARPWNSPKGWETGLPSTLTEGR